MNKLSIFSSLLENTVFCAFRISYLFFNMKEHTENGKMCQIANERMRRYCSLTFIGDIFGAAVL